MAIVLLCIFAVQGTQNKAFTLEEQVNTAQSDIRVQEKRRVDLVYNLSDCVMQYDKHEAETLTAIVEGRGSSGDIENVATAITAVSEAYPELKSNENYKELMNELSITENLIAEYRSNFNKQVKEYNRYVRQFPARLFLNTFPISKFELPGTRYIDTIYESSHVRYEYYGIGITHTGTIFTTLSDNTISDSSPFYEDLTIDEAVNRLEKGVGTTVFWIFWIIGTGVIVFKFYERENEWLE